MRKTITLLAVCALALASLASCNRNKYSCDPDVEEWTRTHLNEYLSAERESIVSLPLSRQMAVYNGLSPEGRARLWEAKLTILINDDKNYSNDERVLFNLLLDFVSPKLFDEKSDTEKLFSEYEALAKRIFEGKQEKFASALCTWMTEEEYMRSLIADSRVLTKIDEGGYESHLPCTCRHSIGCSGGGTCNRNLSCKEKEKGCGFMGNYSCDGVCD